jgi:putative transposase
LGGRGTRRSDEPSKLIADAHGWRVVDTELMPDHEHLFVRVGPTDAPVLVVPAFKCRTARVLGQEFPHRRNHTKVLWSPSDFVASVVDESEPTVYCYVEYQWHAVAP